ncbi:uncharacterized protein BXZ73DRAFT_107892 [Epithele typhae]|uniref:uncharacterized protein n=1 Tax=Epithele typhae TaxID=378194 RepID=UPI0020079BAB|nr:uncharacterized protein BXZ73DRAFT_107892 [Epithele typhae]KAH9911623.1 hypothetical protein BXZ73DRAFT_107892 [Epithele typhae]
MPAMHPNHREVLEDMIHTRYSKLTLGRIEEALHYGRSDPLPLPLLAHTSTDAIHIALAFAMRQNTFLARRVVNLQQEMAALLQRVQSLEDHSPVAASPVVLAPPAVTAPAPPAVVPPPVAPITPAPPAIAPPPVAPVAPAVTAPAPALPQLLPPPPPPPSPPAPTPRRPAIAPPIAPVAPALAPLFTFSDPAVSSLTAVRGWPDYSLRGHPMTVYKQWWFSPTPLLDLRDRTLKRYAPFEFDNGMRAMMGPAAEDAEDNRFQAIQANAAAMGVRVWADPSRLDFGNWADACIITLNAAHHLRLTALDGNPHAAKAYFAIYFFNVHGVLRRHEAARYVVRHYAEDSPYLPDDPELRIIKGLARKGKAKARARGFLAGGGFAPVPLTQVYAATDVPFLQGFRYTYDNNFSDEFDSDQEDVVLG